MLNFKKASKILEDHFAKMSPQLQQVLTEIDRLSLTEQIQVIKYINTRQKRSALETITREHPSFYSIERDKIFVLKQGLRDLELDGSRSTRILR